MIFTVYLLTKVSKYDTIFGYQMSPVEDPFSRAQMVKAI
jgi:hypothetical protein